MLTAHATPSHTLAAKALLALYPDEDHVCAAHTQPVSVFQGPRGAQWERMGNLGIGPRSGKPGVTWGGGQQAAHLSTAIPVADRGQGG